MPIELVRRWALRIALALLVAILLAAGPRACRRAKQAEAEQKVAVEQKNAATASGADAVATVGAAAARERQSDQLSTVNEREIRHAEGAKAPVGAAVGAAGLDGLCRRAAYRDSERCRLRGVAAR